MLALGTEKENCQYHCSQNYYKKAFTKILSEAIHFVVITKTQNKLEKEHKKIAKIIVSGNYFVIISASMVFKSGERGPPQL